MLFRSRFGLQMALLFIDLDGFKAVNDRFGHNKGDELLKDVARLFRRTIRSCDLVSRVGGDEFVVMLYDIKDIRNAEDVAEKLLRNGSRNRLLSNDQYTVSFSIGIAIAVEGEDIASLMHRGDEALYAAKKRGKNQWVVHAVK